MSSADRRPEDAGARTDPQDAGAPADTEDRSFADAAPGAARGVRSLTGEQFSVADSVGGVRGLVESALPGLLFVVVYLVTRELTPALVMAGTAAAVAVLLRLVQRTPVTQAFSGVVGVGIGLLWASRTGEAQDFFAWGLWVNAVWGGGTALSVLLRWPLVGVVVSLLRGVPMDWRRGRDARSVWLRRRYVWATWLWVGMFAVRLAVQLPLYLQGADAVGWLGTARLAMGVPLFAAVLWVTWLLVGPRAERAAPPGLPATPPR